MCMSRHDGLSVIFAVLLDSLLVTVSSFNGFYYYFRITFPLCKFRGLPGSTLFSFPVMKRRKYLGMKRSSQPSSRTREASNAKSTKTLFHFKPVKVNKFEYCNNLWKQNIFHNPVNPETKSVSLK